MEKIKHALEALIKSAERVSSHLATFHEEVPPSQHPCRIVDKDIDIAKAVLSELEGSKPKELTNEEIGELARLHVVAYMQTYSSHDTVHAIIAVRELLEKVRDQGYLSPPPKEHDASFDLLWIKLMDALKKRGIAPSNANELFALIGDLRKSSNSHEVQPKEQGAEPVKVGCFGDDGFVRVHGKDETCDVCATPTSREKAMEEAGEEVIKAYRGFHEAIEQHTGKPYPWDPMVSAIEKWTTAKSTK